MKIQDFSSFKSFSVTQFPIKASADVHTPFLGAVIEELLLDKLL